MENGNRNPLRRWHRWVAGLDRARRIRVRFLEVLGVFAAAALCLTLVAAGIVRPPQRRPRVKPADMPDSTWERENADAGEYRAGAYTLLLAGRDTGGGGNTDTVILACFDTRNRTLCAMSLPRDTMVNVSWHTKKLNTVYNYSKGKDKQTQAEKGIAGLKTHVGKLTGIVPDFHVVVEWDAVGELVDALGGVTFDVPYDMNYDDPEQDLHIHQQKGERRLTGSDAMQVIRWRKNNGAYGHFQIGDSGRMKVQQDFLMAVARECLQAKSLLNIPKFAEIFTEKVDTDLTVGNLVWFAQQASEMDAEKDIRFTTMPYTNYSRGAAYALPNVRELLTVLNDGLNPYEEEITAGDLEVLVLQKDGSFTVTSGTLADSSLARPYAVSAPKASQPQPADPEDTPPTQLPTETPAPAPEMETEPPAEPAEQIRSESEESTNDAV